MDRWMDGRYQKYYLPCFEVDNNVLLPLNFSIPTMPHFIIFVYMLQMEDIGFLQKIMAMKQMV